MQALEISADLSRSNDISRVIQETEDHYRGLDILINNAGIDSNETVMNASDENGNSIEICMVWLPYGW